MDRRRYPNKNDQRRRDSQDYLRDFIKEIDSKTDLSKLPATKPLGKTNCYVIGVGGGGNNTINRLKTTSIRDAYCICMNTDLQHLNSVRCDGTLLIGKKTTRGLGSGGRPELGRAAAEESYLEIQRLVADADVVFLTCGLGGGTGTGAIPIIAEIAKNAGAIVLGVVTLPFSIEGSRKEKAAVGLKNLKRHCDTVVVIENDRLLEIVPNLPIEEAFSVADEVLAKYISSIISTVSQPGLINVDFADLKTVVSRDGVTICGVGEATGENRAEKAVISALDSPLITVDYSLGTAALIQVTGGATMSLKEASSVVELIRGKLHPGAEVIWGTKVDRELGDLIRITIIISGVQSKQIVGKRQKRPILQSSSLSSTQDSQQLQKSSPLPPSREKENWLKKDTVPKLKELRKVLRESQRAKSQEERVETRPAPRPKDDSEDEFWDELGIEKGLK